MQATTPLVLTLTPAMTAMTARADIASRIGQSPFSADRDAALAGIRTVPYTLKKGGDGGAGARPDRPTAEKTERAPHFRPRL
ncbi:hypothetical protein EA118_21385 [Salmonella enterica subsp. enterica serovar Typhimurium]|nr:hypothetical protein [Salmonella enterica subsp. enterica serovar Typhimurium]